MKSIDIEKMAEILECVPSGMIVTDMVGTIVKTNSHLCRILGYQASELEGQPLETLVPHEFRQRHERHRSKYVESPTTRPMGAEQVLYGLHRSGRRIPIEIGLNPIETDQGRFILSSVSDVSEHRRIQEELLQLNEMQEQSLKERELLLQEIHHRVKNNLQVLSSLLGLQIARSPSAEVREGLREYLSRVQSMALVHSQLYGVSKQSRLRLSAYVRNLFSNVASAYAIEAQVELELRSECEISLPINQAIPLGLVLNELATNSMKHAFGGRSHGKLSAHLWQSPGMVCVDFSDDGCGLPPEIDVSKSQTLGLKIIQLMVLQLEGQLSIQRLEAGTLFHIEFPDQEN